MTGRRGGAVLVTVAVLVLAVAACGGSSSPKAAARSTTTAAVPTTTTTTRPAPNPDDALKLNQIQVIGTHNSYHVAAPKAEQVLLGKLSPVQEAQRQYTHPPLATQLGAEKIRHIELDVYVDTKGGLYAHPVLRAEAGLGPYDEPAMSRPGIKVMHEQDVDYHSVCVTLHLCLTEAKAWSDAHPGHVPLAIDIDFKDGPLIFNVPGQAKPERWTPDQMKGLDQEIVAVFPLQDIITPDAIRGTYPTLNAAVTKGHNWPTLGSSRGKVMFLIANGDPYRLIYLADHPQDRGGILFTNATPGQPDAAYVDLDDPIADAAQIKADVAAGYLVRTLADSRDAQGQSGDTTQRDAALASGAQWVSTDYPGPDGAKAQFGTDYVVELPGFRAARCDPVTAPPGCDDAEVEPGS